MNAPESVTANFQASTVKVTVGTGPAGLSFTVDGTAYSSAQALTWAIGTNHTIATTSPQTPVPGTQYTFASWSDGGTISHSVTASAGTTSYSASFNTSYQLTTAAHPANGGTVSPASGSYYPPSTVVSLLATANSGYVFSSWTGSVASASSASTSVTMSAAQSVTANFKAIPTITWAAPAAITYGTALGGTQLDATASVAGKFVYTPAAGTIPQAGTSTLSVNFSPTDAADYTTATAIVSITVNVSGSLTI